MKELNTMQNIGKEMQQKLKSVNIDSAEELTRIGSKEAFFRLKLRYSNVCLVHLYALQGAVDGVKYNQLPDNVKHDLKNYCDDLAGK